MNNLVFKNNNDLVNYLYENGTIQSKKIKDVMKKVNRFNYCLCEYLTNSPYRILENQTISAPHIHARALELLKDKLKPGNKVLDIGCGSGYITTCFSHLLKVNKNKKSVVVGIDIYKKLVELTKENMMKNDKNVLSKMYGGNNKNNNVHILCRNGWVGYKPLEKYDAIHVGASASEIPRELVKQLKVSGKMLIPVGNSYLLITKKKPGKYMIKDILSVRFVPLILKKDTINYNDVECIN